ncbi:MAG: FAD-dependent pyridine nucleotide-disulfide oxidoreductase [Nitrosospira multiformis]|jgi:NADH dehydrogenase FAD-containing subunit|nr:FAD-dependent pyridine nucleotide-disulfide oxidoreductase [Nitrosospira multiformis]
MKKEIVVIGGGFAGINLVRHLADGPGFPVTLVDRNNYNAFPPLVPKTVAGARADLGIAVTTGNYRQIDKHLGASQYGVNIRGTVGISKHRCLKIIGGQHHAE